MMPAATACVATPFPGLRSYRIAEADWFFGRERKSDAMAKKLARGRFLAIVGESGCGKSSLVRAGLLSTLEAGLLAEAGSQWKVVDMHPGGDPIDSLSAALLESGYKEGSSREVLERDPGALAKMYSGNKGFSGSLLLLVDQFEELFRYSAHRDEKAGFVQLILEAARQPNAPIYVVLTMRSDFLGECAQFRGLPEEINEGQYLVPRMTRENLRQAIEGPIRLAGAEIEPRLTQILLDEVGSEPDQLPVLQHALMRTWNNWVARGEPNDAVREDPDYVKTGRLQHALSDHADEALRDAAKVLGQEKAEALGSEIFPLLSDRDANGRDVRRPVSIGEMKRVSGFSYPEIRDLLNEFRKPGRTFVLASREEMEGKDPDDIEYDISHESLIRQWEKLRNWATEEAQDRDDYLYFAKRVERGGELLTGTDLALALKWRARNHNKQWAERYGGNFQATVEFIERSRKRRLIRTVILFSVLGAVLLAVPSWLLLNFQARQKQKYQRQEGLAVQAAQEKGVQQGQAAALGLAAAKKGDFETARTYFSKAGAGNPMLPIKLLDQSISDSQSKNDPALSNFKIARQDYMNDTDPFSQADQAYKRYACEHSAFVVVASVLAAKVDDEVKRWQRIYPTASGGIAGPTNPEYVQIIAASFLTCDQARSLKDELIRKNLANGPFIGGEYSECSDCNLTINAPVHGVRP